MVRRQMPELVKPAPRGSSAPRSIKMAESAIVAWSEVFKLLADRNRLKIVLALAQAGEMHVGALCELLGQSQPAVSHHLTLMRFVGLVSCRRDGKRSYYYLTLENLHSLLGQLFGQNGPASPSQLQIGNMTLTCKWK